MILKDANISIGARVFVSKLMTLSATPPPSVPSAATSASSSDSKRKAPVAGGARSGAKRAGGGWEAGDDDPRATLSAALSEQDDFTDGMCVLASGAVQALTSPLRCGVVWTDDVNTSSWAALCTCPDGTAGSDLCYFCLSIFYRSSHVCLL